MARGFEKAGGKRVTTSSGVPQRTVYTQGRAGTLSKPIYGSTPSSTTSRRALDKADIGLCSTRESHLIGKR